LHVEGGELTIRRRGGANDRPPLISVKTFSADATIPALWRRHVSHLRLEGLSIDLPPKPAAAAEDAGRPAPPQEGPRPRGEKRRVVIVDVLESMDARLAIHSSKPQRPPRVWDIHKLIMRGVGIDQKMPFEAVLTNALPPGQIQTSGSFGPWNVDDPGRTPLEGSFDFANADLSVFKGIAGMLSARGTFGGELERIDVKGETDTPQFSVAIAGQPVPLHATYHSIVDGTNGNTILERIDASFLQTSIVAKGDVVGTPGVKGRTVTLDVTMPRAMIEDVLELAVKATTPPLTGALRMSTRFVLPPGESDVVERLQLDGRFTLASAKFTNYNVQGKIDELSRRGRGAVAEPKPSVVSDMEGRFKLAGGVLGLTDLKFGVPGAVVALDGQYALRPETLDFKGLLLLDAKVSETVTGYRSILLKIVDPLFKRPGGGSAIPIKIAGRRSKPAFGLDVGRVFKRKAD
jgi:hypothetical protein